MRTLTLTPTPTPTLTLTLTLTLALTQGTALYKFEVWANPVTETVEFKFCDALGRKIELEGRGMEGETHHMGSPPAGDPNPNPNPNPSPNPKPNPDPNPNPNPNPNQLSTSGCARSGHS